MSEMAATAGGRCTVESAAGRGTTVRACLPYEWGATGASRTSRSR